MSRGCGVVSSFHICNSLTLILTRVCLSGNALNHVNVAQRDAALAGLIATKLNTAIPVVHFRFPLRKSHALWKNDKKKKKKKKN